MKTGFMGDPPYQTTDPSALSLPTTLKGLPSDPEVFGTRDRTRTLKGRAK